MTFLFANIRKNLLRIAASPWSLAIWIGVPLLVGALLSGVMGGSGGATPKVHLLLADNDQSVLSGVLSEMLASDQLGEMLVLESVTEDAGHAILDEGGASAMLIVPAEFQVNFLTSAPQELRLVVNPLQSILPEMAEELTGTIADFGAYAQLAFGDELSVIYSISQDLESETAQAETQETAVSAITKMARLAPALRTAPIEVEVVTTEGASEATLLMLFFPGLLMMTVIFAAQGLAEDLWAEREMGTLRRLQSPSASSSAWRAARLASAGLVLIAVLLPLTLAGFAFLGLSFAHMPLVLIWSALAGLMLMQLASLVQVLAPTRKAGALFSTLVFFPLLLMGGSFFPFENMPDFLATIGRATPNGMMLEPMKRWLIGTGSLAGFALPLAIALSAALSLHTLIAWRLRTGFASE